MPRYVDLGSAHPDGKGSSEEKKSASRETRRTHWVGRDRGRRAQPIRTEPNRADLYRAVTWRAVSIPPFLNPPKNTTAYHLRTSRGEFAVIDTAPAHGVTRRGTVLLVPGFTGSKEDFIAILGALGEAGHRAVAYDQRGQYQTAGPADPDEYTFQTLVNDVYAVIEALGDGPVHLVGHSFGGLVARMVALTDPAPLRSLTIMSSGPAAVTEGDQARLRMLLAALEQHDLPAIWDAMQALEAEAGGQVDVDEDVHEFLRVRFVSNTPASLVGMARLLLDEPDRVDELARVPLPKHVLHGVEDHAWDPAWQAEMARRLRARHTVIEGAGHSPAAERPAQTAAALVTFWADVDGLRLS